MTLEQGLLFSPCRPLVSLMEIHSPVSISSSQFTFWDMQ